MARIDGHSPRPSQSDDQSVAKRDGSGTSAARASRRVEEPISGRHGRFGYCSGFRPTAHRWIGVGLLVLGAYVAVANDSMLFLDVPLLPFGHLEVWLITGLLIAGVGTWFLGLFDPSVRRRGRPTG